MKTYELQIDNCNAPAKRYEIRGAIQNAGGAHPDYDWSEYYSDRIEFDAASDSAALAHAAKLQEDHEFSIPANRQDSAWESNAPSYLQCLFESDRKIEA